MLAVLPPAVLGGSTPQTLDWSHPPAEAALRLFEPVPLAATASSGLPVTFRVESGPAVIEGGRVTATNVGAITLVASQPGDAVFDAVAGTRTVNRATVSAAPAGRWPAHFRGAPHHIQVAGDRAYVIWNNSELGHLLVYNIRDPAAPALLGRWTLLASIHDLHVVGNRAHLTAQPNTLHIVDLTDETRPVRVGRTTTGYWPVGLQVLDNLAHLVAGSYYEVYDVSDPTLPRLLKSSYREDHKDALEVVGNRAYLAGGYNADGQFGLQGLEILDIADPTAPRRLGHLDLGTPARSLQVVGPTAYLGTIFDGLRVVDVSEVSRPRLLARWPSGGQLTEIEAVSVAGSRLHLVERSAGLRILDVTDPARPSVLGTYAMTNGVYEVAAGAELAFVGAADGLHTLNTADPANPVLLGRVPAGEPGVSRDLLVSDTLACVADGNVGVSVIRIAALGAPERIGRLTTFGPAYAVALAGTNLVVAEGYSGVSLADLADPANPRRLGGLDTPGWATGLAVEGTRVFVADYGGGLRILDVSDPAAPMPLGQVETLTNAYAVALSGGHAFVADGPAGLRVVDVRDPSWPAIVATHPTREPAVHVEVRGTFAAVANGVEIEVFDITQPDTPARVGVLEVPGGAAAVEWNGPVAVVASYGRGVHAVDLSVPGRPLLLGGVDTAGSALAAAWRDGQLFVADHFDGLKLFRFEAGLPQELAFEPPAVLSVNDSPVTLNAASNRGLPVTFSVVSGPATVDGHRLTFTAAGVVVVRAEQAGDAQFLPVRVERSITVSLGGQSVAWQTPTNHAVLRLGTAHSLAATASSGLPITFSVRHGPAAIEGGLVTVTNVGTVVLRAEQPGTDAYRPAHADLALNRSWVLAQEVGRWGDDVAGRAVLDVAVDGIRACVAAMPDGLVVLDVTNPATPVPRSTYDPGVSAAEIRALRVSGAYAWLAAGPGPLQILDLADLRAPRPAGVVPAPPWVPLAEVWDVDVDPAADLVYVAHGTGGMEILDGRVPDQPVSLSRTEIPGEEVVRVRATGTRCWAATERLLVLFDVSDPTQPRQLGSRSLAGGWAAFDATDSLATVAGPEATQQFYTLAPSGWPVPQGDFPTGGPARAADLTDDFAFLATEPGQLVVLDVADPAVVIQAGSLPFPGEPRAVRATAGHAWVAAGTGGLQVFRLREGIVQRLPALPERHLTIQNSPLTLPPVSDHGLPLEYAVLAGPAVIAEGKLRLLGPGEVILRATQAGDVQFLPAIADERLEVTAPPFTLAIRRAGDAIELTWPAWASSHGLEWTEAVGAAVDWQRVDREPVTDGTTSRLTLPLTGSSRWFRLRWP